MLKSDTRTFYLEKANHCTGQVKVTEINHFFVTNYMLNVIVGALMFTK